MANFKTVFLFGGKLDKSLDASVKTVGSKMKGVERAIESTRREQEKLNREIKEARERGEDVSGLTRKYAKLERQVESLDREHKQLNDTRKRFTKGSNFTKGMVKAGVAIGVTTGAVALLHRATFGLANEVADDLDIIDKWAEKLGLTTEAFQELRGAADLSGVDPRKFDVGIQRFARRMAQFRDQDTGEAKEALQELGFNRLELQGKSLEEVFTAVGDRFSQVEDAQTRIRLAQKLFDSEGVDLGNLFKDGAPGIEKMRKLFRDSGAIFGKDATKAVEEYKESMTILRASLMGVRNEFAVSLMPALSTGIQNLTKWIGENRGQISVWIQNFTDLNNGTLPHMLERAEKLGDAIIKMANAIDFLVKKAGGFEKVGKTLAFADGIINPLSLPSTISKAIFGEDEEEDEGEESESRQRQQRPTRNKPKRPIDVPDFQSPVHDVYSVVNHGSPKAKRVPSNSIQFGDIKLNVTMKSGESAEETGKRLADSFADQVETRFSQGPNLYDMEDDSV